MSQGALGTVISRNKSFVSKTERQLLEEITCGREIVVAWMHACIVHEALPEFHRFLISLNHAPSIPEPAIDVVSGLCAVLCRAHGLGTANLRRAVNALTGALKEHIELGERDLIEVDAFVNSAEAALDGTGGA